MPFIVRTREAMCAPAAFMETRLTLVANVQLILSDPLMRNSAILVFANKQDQVCVCQHLFPLLTCAGGPCFQVHWRVLIGSYHDMSSLRPVHQTVLCTLHGPYASESG
jgi:hypothetical protein